MKGPIYYSQPLRKSFTQNEKKCSLGQNWGVMRKFQRALEFREACGVRSRVRCQSGKTELPLLVPPRLENAITPSLHRGEPRILNRSAQVVNQRLRLYHEIFRE